MYMHFKTGTCMSNCKKNFGEDLMPSLLQIQIFSFDYTAFVVSGNQNSWMTVVAQTDRPKSVRNLCLIEVFGGVLCFPLTSFSDGLGFLSKKWVWPFPFVFEYKNNVFLWNCVKWWGKLTGIISADKADGKTTVFSWVRCTVRDELQEQVTPSSNCYRMVERQRRRTYICIQRRCTGTWP